MPISEQADQAAKKQAIVKRIHQLEAAGIGRISRQHIAKGVLLLGACFAGRIGALMGGALVAAAESAEWDAPRQLRRKIRLSKCPSCGGDVFWQASECPYCHRDHRPGTMRY